MNPKNLKLIFSLTALCIFAVACGFIIEHLRHVQIDEIKLALVNLPSRVIATSAGLTALSYLALTMYDFLGLRYLNHPLSYGKTAVTSFISYAFANNIGLSLLGSVAFRFRLYSLWGLKPAQIAQLILFCSVTFWLGLVSLTSLVFMFFPPPSSMSLGYGPAEIRGVGFLLAALVAAYVVLCAFWRRPLRFKSWVLHLPTWRLAVAQIVASIIDWGVASSVLYVLVVQDADIKFSAFLSVYIAALVASLMSNVPGGLGVFETVFLMAFDTVIPAPHLLGSLLIFRFIYYLVPLAFATCALGTVEYWRRRDKILIWAAASFRWLPLFVPRLFATFAFLGGMVLLFSGALPPETPRLHALRLMVPLTLIETSHFLASMVGAALLIVARGLQRRLDGAYMIAVALLTAGIALSLTKGVDYEEAISLAVTLALLIPCRSAFYRKASLIHQKFTTSWLIAIALTLMSTIWLVFFSFRHVDYSHDLWWTFAFHEAAPRSLRAWVGALVLTVFFGLLRLLLPARADVGLTCQSQAISREVASLISKSEKTYANLAWLGDKSFLFNDAKTAFIMYAHEGRSWVALGDPIGAANEHLKLIWRFRELVDTYDGLPVFYQIDPGSLHLYIEAGLLLYKIGEEARISLATFSLEGRAQKSLRASNNRMTKDRFEFKIVPFTHVPRIIPQLRAISDDWLARIKVKEKKFSLGFFDETYLSHFDIAVIEREGEIVAFANIWPSHHKRELSVDLMRFGAAPPKGVMDFLLTQLLLWGKAEGFETFNLGMAPLSGIESRTMAPAWNRMATVIYNYSDYFYNFQGLRDYKEKYAPEWVPKYIACAGGWSLPRSLVNVATLISGGFTGAVTK